MRFKLFAVLGVFASAAVVLALATHSMRAEDEAKPEGSGRSPNLPETAQGEGAKQADAAEKEAPPPKRFVVPEGGVKELAAFLEGLRNFQPEDLIEFQDFRKYGPPAMKAAAEKILALEQDKTSQAYQTAYELVLLFRFQDLEKSNAQQKQTLVADLNEHVQGKGKDLGRTDLQLAMSAAQMLEYSGENKLGAEVYTALGKAVGELNDERYADLLDVCEKSVRRLSLVGQPIKVEGSQLGGKKFDIASLKGKVVLVDFWATWCGPCREEVPNLKEQYGKYNGRGFEIVGISLDDNRTAVEDYVAEEKIPWIMLHDSLPEGNPVADYYGIMSIPCMILVGRDGNVVSLNARGEELNRLLAEEFGKIDASKVNSNSGE